jgi:hypothetical protein
MPKVDFYLEEAPNRSAFVIDADPARVSGARTAFGAEVRISALLQFDRTQAVPISLEGALLWENDSSGLPIPAQSAGRGGTFGLAVPITDAQLATFERRRGQKEPAFQLQLRGVAQDTQTGRVRGYAPMMASMPFTIPRDRWADVLDACGYGRIRIVELPPPPDRQDAAWAAIARRLEAASRDFNLGRYGESMVSTRTVIEEMVSIIEADLKITPLSPAFKNRVEAVSKHLTTMHASRGGDPFAVIGAVLGAAFGFTSEPAHRGFEVASREDAEFALFLTTALYSHLARRPLA